MKPDYVICVDRAPGFGWLAIPSDEQDPDDLVVTADEEMVARYSTPDEAMPYFRRLVAAHPKRSFRMMSLPPLQSNG